MASEKVERLSQTYLRLWWFIDVGLVGNRCKKGNNVVLNWNYLEAKQEIYFIDCSDVANFFTHCFFLSCLSKHFSFMLFLL